MITDTNPPTYASNPNVVENAADAASDAVEATRNATASALDAAASGVESLRSSLSPVLDATLDYTRKEPLKALAWAMTAGVVFAAVFRPRSR